MVRLTYMEQNQNAPPQVPICLITPLKLQLQKKKSIVTPFNLAVKLDKKWQKYPSKTITKKLRNSKKKS